MRRGHRQVTRVLPVERRPLHDLVQLREDLASELFFSEGVLTPAQERRLDAIAGSADKKIELIGLTICDDQSDIAGIEHEEQRLAERRRVRLNRIERKKEYLQLCMERLGLRQVAGTLCTVTLQQNAVAATRTNAPQSDLFANQSRSANGTGSHVRIR